MPRIENLSDYVKTVKSIAPISVNATGATATAVDGRGFARARHVILVGVFGTTSGFDAEITESATSTGTYTLIASSGITAVTGSAAGTIFVVDVPVNSAKPYQKLRATTSTSTVVIASVVDLYNSPNLPTSPTFTQEVTIAGY